MFDLHIFSRFLRLLRSIRRSLLAFFVAIAMLLATFVIAPAYALSAGESAGASVDGKANIEQTESAKADGAGGAKASGVKSDGAKADGAQKQSVQQSEPNKTESDKKDTGSSSTLNKDNKESKPDSKQQNANNKAGNKADNNAKSTDKTKSSDKTRKTVEKSAEKSAANKNGKDAKNKAADSAKAANGTERSAEKATDLPEACGSKTFKKCYVVSYYNGKIVVDNNHPVLIQRGNTITIKPKFKIKSTNKQADMPSGVWFKLEQYLKDPVPSWANFEKGNGATKVKDTSKDKTGFDGSVTLRPGKWDRGDHRFKVFAYYKSEKIYATITVKVDISDVQNDLSLSLYDFENAQAGAAIKDNKIIINPKPKGSDSSGSDTGGTDKKDVYDPINKLFIESQSKDKPGFIYHRMICHETGSDNYTLDNVNGLSLGTQTQFKHMENKDRPDENADNSALYENDPYTERSQSWITGTPAKAGTFECKVFAIKDVDYKIPSNSKKLNYIKIIDHFNNQTSNAGGIKNLFNNPDSLNSFSDIDNTYSIDKTIDWNYKSVTIEVKSSEPQKPKIGKNDLTLKVYPFKNGDGPLPAPLTSDNNYIYAMLGMELKPFIDATSAADSANKITLRVLCSKGEKKDSGSQSAQSSGSSQPTQPSESPQDANDFEYKTWSSNLADLGLSVPADTDQNTCHSNKEGETTCKSSDPSKKVAARTDKEVSIKPSLKPTAVGNYQCVVYALKPKALDAFNDAISKATQSGNLTPDSIKSALTTASSTATPTAFAENKDFAAFTFNLHLVSNFTLPHTGGQSWNLQLGILAALLVNLLAAGFVVSQSERARKLIFGRRRGLCNYV
ncbi:hypothetical protein GK675_00150 [Bifidobacteriaceae bacterium NR002]|nr:hypothetical protein [Bifidobacteriaceae bacterium NR002]MDZ7550003.1 hypothetical protein [Bifidobacteriaceae bacterium NR047]